MKKKGECLIYGSILIYILSDRYYNVLSETHISLEISQANQIGKQKVYSKRQSDDPKGLSTLYFCSQTSDMTNLFSSGM
jgi:hypothetical protein